MKLKNTLKIVAFVVALCPAALIAQETSVKVQTKEASSDLAGALKGLTKMNDEQKQKQRGGVQIDPNNTAFFSPEGKKISITEFAPYSQNEDYTPDLYVDDKNEIKAIVLRKASDAEKIQRKNAEEASDKKEKEEEGKPLPPNLTLAVQGLKKMTVKELVKQNGMQLKLVLGRDSVFLSDGTKLTPEDYQKYSKDTDYSANYYVDAKNDVRVIVFKKNAEN